MEERIIRLLEKLGFNKNEIKVYLDLLYSSSSSVVEISKRTEIHRSNTYDAIRKLENLGFVKEVIMNNKRLFNAMDPETIKDYLKQQENEIEILLPYMKMHSKREDCNEEVFIIKGTFANREAMNDLLKSNKQLNAYGASYDNINALGTGFLNEFHNERIKRGIMMRIVFDETAMDRAIKLNKMKFTEVRYIPKKYHTNSTTILCDDIVLISVFSNPITAIKIKNKVIAESYNKYFEFSYRLAKPLKNPLNQLTLKNEVLFPK